MIEGIRLGDTEAIFCDGGPDGSGPFLQAPLMFDLSGQLIDDGSAPELLQAIVDTGTTLQLPQVHNATPADVARIDQAVKLMSERLGIPMGPPDP